MPVIGERELRCYDGSAFELAGKSECRGMVPLCRSSGVE